MFLNSRFVRITVGMLLLAAGIIAVLPALTGYTSLDGTVNARLTIISAPIEGTITASPPKTGTAVAGGTELFGIRNDRVVRTIEIQNEAELIATKERLAAIANQRLELAELEQKLREQRHAYEQANVDYLVHEIAIRGQRITTAQALQQAATADLARKQRLGVSGIVAEVSVEQARAASVTAENTGNIARAELEQLKQQLDAVKRGVFVGGGRNDVPYSQQRLDEVSIQLAELKFREKDLKGRITQLEQQRDEERTRNRALSYAVIYMPFEGVIWRNNVVEGSHVIAGNELLQALDCRDLFVEILVPEVNYDEIYPGRDAQIRLLGRSDTIQGKVLAVRGSAAVVEDVILAAKIPPTRDRAARIRVGMPYSEINTDYENFCQVGRSVQVRFRTRTLPIVHWFKALWLSIT